LLPGGSDAGLDMQKVCYLEEVMQG
jgi:hypothetical protein